AAVRKIEIEEKDGIDVGLAIDDLDGLMALVQIGALEIHVWGSRASSIEKPDRLVFDLDPAQDVRWSEVADTARRLRQELSGLGLRSFLKVTGGKGLHLTLPIQPRRDWNDIRRFCRTLTERLVRDHPQKLIAVASKAQRHGKIFVDYLRNGRGATAIA